ncbi:MAG: hypothetical protein M1837_006469 [Sclerophora amabilis]|nr:MAG: hypothetical protein M1837_006469 [Sclerophora amabilis]
MRFSFLQRSDDAASVDKVGIGSGAFHSSIDNASLCTLLLCLGLSFYSIYQDYVAFINLGPGGTPSNFLGYLRVSCLRVLALRNPYVPPALSIALQPKTGYLPGRRPDLPKRVGPRPQVTGIAPQRQTTQKGSAANLAALLHEIRALPVAYPDSLRLGTSCFEKHETALFSLFPVNRTCSGEICHAHPSDASLHMTLHPADARMVLERGWGQRHPLAKGGWFTRFVPVGFVMVYAPRSPAELEVVMDVIHAAAWWVSGQALDRAGDGSGTGPKGC